jgi:hypothetical protein
VCRSSNGSWKHAGCSLLETKQEAEEEQAKQEEAEEEEEEEVTHEARMQMWERLGLLHMRVVREAGEEEAMGRRMDPRTGRLRRMQPPPQPHTHTPSPPLRRHLPTRLADRSESPCGKKTLDKLAEKRTRREVERTHVANSNSNAHQLAK